MAAPTDPATLVLLTNFFPYATGEEYLESELAHLAAAFPRVVIVPTMHQRGHRRTREVPPNVVVVPLDLDLSLPGRVGMVARQLTRRRERLVAVAPWSTRAVRHPLRHSYEVYFEARSTAIAERALSALDAAGIHPGSVQVLYPYWLYVTARVAIELRKQWDHPGIPIRSRAHRYDVEEDASPLRWLPEREFLMAHLDAVHPVSARASTRLREAYPGGAEVSVRRLGSRSAAAVAARNVPFHVVSCSTVRRRKRLDLIADAVRSLREGGVDVRWTHFGSGSERELRRLRRTVRGLEPHVELAGHVPNETVIERLAVEPFSLFLNVSESEGVPVSIMEAMSAGIPVAATDVGGSAELVGLQEFDALLPEDCRVEHVVRVCEQALGWPAEEFARHSRTSRRIWEQMCDPDVLYADFAEELRRTRPVTAHQ